MPQAESPDELAAADVVRRTLGRVIEYTDLTGGVDYTSEDGELALAR